MVEQWQVSSLKWQGKAVSSLPLATCHLPAAHSMRILGIDPGSLVTGFGIIDSDGRSSAHVHSGCIRMGGEDLVARLG
jgi:hypothetical protein